MLLFSSTCSFIRMSQTSYTEASQEKRGETVRSFNFTSRYIDDGLSLNNSRFGDFVNRIYPTELEIKDITDTGRLASYLDLIIEIDHEGQSRTKLYDKRDYLKLPSRIFSLDVATFKQHLHMEYVSLS